MFETKWSLLTTPLATWGEATGDLWLQVEQGQDILHTHLCALSNKAHGQLTACVQPLAGNECGKMDSDHCSDMDIH